jgi:hypothetical protein
VATESRRSIRDPSTTLASLTAACVRWPTTSLAAPASARGMDADFSWSWQPVQPMPHALQRTLTAERHDPDESSTTTVRRQEARHLGPAQEGAGVAGAAVCRKNFIQSVFEPLEVQPEAGWCMIGGDGRYSRSHQVIQTAIRHGGGQRLSGACWSGQGGTLDPRRQQLSSASTGPAAALVPVGQPQPRAGLTRTSASSTTSPMAAPRPRAIAERDLCARTEDDRPLPVTVEAADVDLRPHRLDQRSGPWRSR